MIDIDSLKPLIASKKQLIDFFHSCEIFENIDEKLFDTIIEKASIKEVLSGHLLCDYSDKLNDVYILLHGRMRLFTKAKEKIIEFIPTSTTGEIDLLTHTAKSVRIEVIRDSLLIQINKTDFLDLLKNSSQLLENTCRIIAKKLHHHFSPNEKNNQFADSIAFIATDEGIDTYQVVKKIQHALQNYGPTLLLTKQEAEKNHFNSNEFSEFLVNLERRYKWILYVADMKISSWTKFCLRQVDEIFILMSPKQPTELSQEEKYILFNEKILAKKRLLFLHQKSAVIKNTSTYLVHRKQFPYYHISQEEENDIKKIARIIANRCVGVVLSGGGARGLAQIGVLQALLEENIDIDFIGGTSMGAVISGLYALGYPTYKIFSISEKLFKNPKALFDPTFPLFSFFTGKKLYKKLLAHFNVSIEDLKITYFCNSTDLFNKNVVIHDKGPLYKAIRASLSLPGIFPPVWDNKKILIDGGLLNVLPIDIMAGYSCINKIIAVDVSDKHQNLYDELKHSHNLSFFQIIKNLFQAKKAVYPIFHILSYAYDYYSQNQKNTLLNSSLADVYIHPPVETFTSLDFTQLKKVKQLGYDYAKEHCNIWKQKLEMP